MFVKTCLLSCALTYTAEYDHSAIIESYPPPVSVCSILAGLGHTWYGQQP